MNTSSSLAFVALACVLVAPGVRGQGVANYHLLSNGGDSAYIGVGAGGGQTVQDGLMTFVAGEDLRGARKTWLGDFGYRQVKFIESACVFGPSPSGPPGLALRFPNIVFEELDGLNGNAPVIFTNPACTHPGFPLGASGFVPYGVMPGSTASFVVTTYPSVFPAPSQPVLLPNNGLSPGAFPNGSHTTIGLASATLPIGSTGMCWSVQFTWTQSALASLDDIDGWAHYVSNSSDDNQYWLMSDNEENLWQSQSVGLTGGATALNVFPPNMDYALDFNSADPITVATLAPVAGPTYSSSWTKNVSNEFGVVLNPNGGFDVGRGSSIISFNGHSGVPSPNTGLGNQDPAASGAVPTLGFATWDDGGDGNGSVRLTWLSIDILSLSIPKPGNPATDPGVLKQGGTVRVPVGSAGLLQPLTQLCFPVFGHVTRPGFIDPYGPSGIFYSPIGGASQQIPITLPAPCFGIALNITYGTSGRKGTLGAPGALTFDQDIAATSGTRQLFILE